MSKQPPCPECEKLVAVSEESNKIGKFLSWLEAQGVTFCEWDDYDEQWTPHEVSNLSINAVLAKYYDIDLDKVEKERRALLDWLRENNG